MVEWSEAWFVLLSISSQRNDVAPNKARVKSAEEVWVAMGGTDHIVKKVKGHLDMVQAELGDVIHCVEEETIKGVVASTSEEMIIPGERKRFYKLNRSSLEATSKHKHDSFSSKRSLMPSIVSHLHPIIFGDQHLVFAPRDICPAWVSVPSPSLVVEDPLL